MEAETKVIVSLNPEQLNELLEEFSLIQDTLTDIKVAIEEGKDND